MNSNPEKKIKISPGQLWNSAGLVQQLVLTAGLLIAYIVIRILTQGNPQSYPGMQNWIANLHSLFKVQYYVRDLFAAPFIGASISLLLFGLDSLAGLLQKKEMKTWVHRSDNMLPVNKTQRHWAFLITFSGSAVEEIMFRAFIFTALIPLWDTWIWSALLLSAVFSLLHAGVQGFWSTVWIFLISIVLCFLLTAGYSIYALVLIHISINLMNLFLIPYLLKRIEKDRN